MIEAQCLPFRFKNWMFISVGLTKNERVTTLMKFFYEKIQVLQNNKKHRKMPSEHQ